MPDGGAAAGRLRRTDRTPRPSLAALAVWLMLSTLPLVAQQTVPTSPPAPSGHDPARWQRAWELHASSLVVDAELGTASRMLDPEFDLGRPGDGAVDLQRAAAGGLDAAIYTVGSWRRTGEPAAASEPAVGAAHRALQQIDGLLLTVARYPERFELVTGAAELRAAERRQRHAALLGIDGGQVLEGDLGLLRLMHRLGVRVLRISDGSHNEFVDGGVPSQSRWGGLNMLGARVIRESNRLGLVIDVGGASAAAIADVLQVSKAPLMLTRHGSQPLGDELLRSLAAHGGIVMLRFDCTTVDPAPGARPPLSAFVGHLVRAVAIAGADHVGIASGFDRAPGAPAGIDDVASLPRLTYELLAAGVPEATIVGLLGGNLLRVLGEVELTMQKLHGEPPMYNDTTDRSPFRR
jgi:membrane dipeptidase